MSKNSKIFEFNYATSALSIFLLNMRQYFYLHISLLNQVRISPHYLHSLETVAAMIEHLYYLTKRSSVNWLNYLPTVAYMVSYRVFVELTESI